MSEGSVLQLLGPSSGGIRRHVSYLTEHLRARGWDVVVAGPRGVLADLDHVVSVPSGADPIAAARAVNALRPLTVGRDLVHAHGLKAGWVAALTRAHPPLVVSVHNLVLDEVAGRSAAIMRWLEGRVPGRADATIAVSREVGRRFDGVRGADRIHVVPPAGPPPAPKRTASQVRDALGVSPDEDLVVTAARLHPQKGLGLLLDAAAQVHRQRPGLRWFVFGDGPMRSALLSEIADRGLERVVVLAGARPSVDDELAAADVVAVTSTWESGPLVVLEAAALGRPIVSTSVGLVPDVVGPGRGRVVPVGDAAAFAAALIEQLDDASPGASEMSGSPARFSPAALAAEVEAVYREVLRSR